MLLLNISPGNRVVTPITLIISNLFMDRYFDVDLDNKKEEDGPYGNMILFRYNFSNGAELSNSTKLSVITKSFV